MAFKAQLGALTAELVAAITSISPKSDPKRFTSHRNSSLQALRHHSFVRTNQFEVEEHLDGVEERFSILGRDGLAESLRERRAALSDCSTKWTPDILHFLLELSDQPATKSTLASLNLLHEPDEEPGVPLRWEDIAKEDGWSDEHALWRNIDYADNSEEDDFQSAISDAESDFDDTSLSSTNGHQKPVDSWVLQSQTPASLGAIQQSQSWRRTSPPKGADGKSRKIPVSELQLVREALFMLQGLETSLFDSKCAPVQTYQMSHVSWESSRALIDSVSECGRRLLPLREIVRRGQDIPLLQVFQESTRRRLATFDKNVSSIQRRFVAIKDDVVVSLPAVLEELRPSLSSLYLLAAIVQQLMDERNAHAFRYLELLFDATCVAQLEGNEGSYRFLGSIFFECFEVYLKPIRLWAEEGRLIVGDKTFFVSGSREKVPLSRIWQHQYKLRRTKDGILHAPKFLQPAASRIFTTGKSIVVLKHLGKYDEKAKEWGLDEQNLDFDSVCGASSELAPFAELFRDAFDGWIQSKHHPASATLQKVLFESCGLWSDLDALQSVFLMTDGSVTDAFAVPIFNSLDSLNPNWHDRFTLTEFAQEAFASCLDSYRLSATASLAPDDDDTTVAGRSLHNGIARVQLTYRVAWPVQLIVPKETIAEYQAVFTLLLQVRRANYILNQHRLLDDMAKDDGSDEQVLYYRLRSKLLCFCTTFHTYLATLVLAPRVARLREDLQAAEDVDAMVAVHSRFVKGLAQEACLGPKLGPIRECIVDLLDLSIRLEESRRANAAKEADEEQEISRLSVISSPLKTPKRAAPSRRGVYVSPREQEEAEMTMLWDEGDVKGMTVPRLTQTYFAALRGISADFDRHLRFISAGLRGVARASSDAAAGKWGLLAEMLGAGFAHEER